MFSREKFGASTFGHQRFFLCGVELGWSWSSSTLFEGCFKSMELLLKHIKLHAATSYTFFSVDLKEALPYS